MNDHLKYFDIVLEPADNQRLANLCGQFDEHLRQIERSLGVEINNRGNNFRVIGDATPMQQASQVLRDLFVDTESDEITPAQVQLLLREVSSLPESEDETYKPVVINTRGGKIKSRGAAQAHYLTNILQNDISFGVGPAGTGKTYLAVACAVEALNKGDVQRILLTRPAVEAGERLGFLPGDLAQKIDPYLRPLYDALYEMFGFERVTKLMDRGVIEVAPLAYMRGRTLNEAFIILDEAQNATTEQMKMFLTRMGFGSKVVVTGDITQVDLPAGKVPGLRQIIDVLKDVEGVSFTFFQSQDVVRHPLVKRVVAAYEGYESQASNKPASV